MTTWQSRLQKLVRHWKQLPEPLNLAFTAKPPSGRRWPKGRPSCPALQEFYSLCDGGRFSYFTFGRRVELQVLRECWGVEDIEAGRYLVFGDTEFGHPLVWDSAQDRVGYYDYDGAYGLVMSNDTGMELMGLSMEEFLNGLFFRNRAGDFPRSRRCGTGRWQELNAFLSLARKQKVEAEWPRE